MLMSYVWLSFVCRVVACVLRFGPPVLGMLECKLLTLSLSPACGAGCMCRVSCDLRALAGVGAQKSNGFASPVEPRVLMILLKLAKFIYSLEQLWVCDFDLLQCFCEQVLGQKVLEHRPQHRHVLLKSHEQQIETWHGEFLG